MFYNNPPSPGLNVEQSRFLGWYALVTATKKDTIDAQTLALIDEVIKKRINKQKIPEKELNDLYQTLFKIIGCKYTLQKMRNERIAIIQNRLEQLLHDSNMDEQQFNQLNDEAKQLPHLTAAVGEAELGKQYALFEKQLISLIPSHGEHTQDLLLEHFITQIDKAINQGAITKG
jgi:hypothetical protein